MVIERLRSAYRRFSGATIPTDEQPRATAHTRKTLPPITIAGDDPLVTYFLTSPGAVELSRLALRSPATQALKAAGIAVVVPLVSQGELVGVLNLGPRLSQQDYSSEDRSLLNTLATQAAPAVRVAQLVRQQQAEARERERIEQELRIARIIQQTLLPKEAPAIDGWQIDAYYQPARAVGGDFYDFIPFEDGRLGVVIGDVTDKGVPAALVMATTRSLLRTAAQADTSPGRILQRVNDLLYPDIPSKMFVTCFFGILDPASGTLRYANAGHDLPIQRHVDRADELRATGMPLGLMPGMTYEERETTLSPGDVVLFYSDGLVEAHNPTRDMFGVPRLVECTASTIESEPLIEQLLSHLTDFAGSDWEQEDDVTLVTLRREPILASEGHVSPTLAGEDKWTVLDSFEVPSVIGNERAAIERVEEAVRELGLSRPRIERLKTAVAEATMNAMEHGNHYFEDLPVQIEVRADASDVAVRIRDWGGSAPIPETPEPDLRAKLDQEQTPRGWGLFLIKHLVDEMRARSDGTHHIVELLIHREEATRANENA